MGGSIDTALCCRLIDIESPRGEMQRVAVQACFCEEKVQAKFGRSRKVTCVSSPMSPRGGQSGSWSRSRSTIEHCLPRVQHLLVTRRPTIAANVLVPHLDALLLDPDPLQALDTTPPFLFHDFTGQPARIILGVALGKGFLVLLAEMGLEVILAGKWAYARYLLTRRLSHALQCEAIAVF